MGAGLPSLTSGSITGTVTPATWSVGTDLQKEAAATWDWVAGGGQVPQERPTKTLQRDWDVTVSRASFRAADTELEPLLLRLESTGPNFEIVQRLISLANPDATITRLIELGVVMLSSK